MKLTKLNCLIAFFLLGLMTEIGAQNRPFFDKSKDLLIAQFDSKPDPDDIHAQAALGSMLAHSDLQGVNAYGVAGAYGKQGGQFIDSDQLFNMIFGNNWTDADANRSASVTRIANKVVPILNNGGKVWVQEAGQSNITRDWLIEVKKRVNGNVVKNNVIVVQHSEWNQNLADNTTNKPAANQVVLNYVRNNTNYFYIDDGNAPFGGFGNHGPWDTPEYRSRDRKWLNQAKNSPNPKAKQYWNEAERVIAIRYPGGVPYDWSFMKNGGLDYSDCAENWWIFNIGNKADSVDKFWSRYVTNTTGSNPDPDPDPDPTPCTGKVFEERNGVAAVEAEDFVSQEKTGKRKWYVLKANTTGTPTPDPDPNHANGASSGGYLEILPDTRVTHGDPLIAGENFSNVAGQLTIVNYKVKFNSPGKYFVWVRAHSTGTEDNGVHVGIDGTWPASGQRMQWCAGKNQWTWESKQRTGANHCGEAQKIFLNVPSAGVHTISFSLREDGFEMDKFVLSKAFTKPNGTGPAPIAADCGDPDPTPTGSCGSKPAGFKVSGATNTAITVNYTNTSSDSRTFELRAFNKGAFTGNINAGVVAFAAGTAGSNAITISGLTAGKSYDLVLRALCQGGNPSTSPVAQITGTTEGGVNPVPTVDKITIGNVGDKPASSAMTFSVNYDATQKRTLYVEVRGPRVNGALGKWYGAKTVDVNAGSGNQDVTVGLSSVPPAGNGYQVRVHIRPVNTSWQQAINADTANFNVNGNGNPPAPPTVETVTLSPVQDAYLEGSKRHNTGIVRLEKNKRTGYLMFDLSGINGTITKADLQFTVASDPGNGNINVNKGNSDNWTENNLSNGNKPAMGDVLGRLNTGYAIGSVKTINLNAGGVNGNKLSLILNATSGNDMAFASKEHASVKAPQLVLTYTTNSSSRIANAVAKNDNSDVKLYPVPLKGMLNVSGVSNGSTVRVVDYMGRLQREVIIEEGQSVIDVYDLPSGHYVVTISKNGKVISRRKISK